MNVPIKSARSPIEFWQRMTDWPEDRPGYVFLANAVRMVGEAAFQGVWQRGDTFAGLNEVEYPKQVGFMAQTLSEDEERLTRSFVAIRTRFQQAKKLLASGLADGKIRFALRHVDGGAFVLQRKDGDPRSIGPGAELWNIDDINPRFAYCQVDLSAPFNGRERGNYFIFIEKTSLQSFIATISVPVPSNVGESGPKHLSPYLKLMLSIANEWDITPDNQPTVESIIAEVQRRWGKLPESERLQRAIATLIREPDSQKNTRKKRIG